MNASMRTKALALIRESQAQRGPVWASYEPGLMVALASFVGSQGWECSPDGKTNRFAGADWVVCVVAH